MRVRAEISDGLRKTGESARVDGDTLRLHSDCPSVGSDWCHVDWKVTLPARMAVSIDNGDGHVAVSGTTGGVDIRNDNGSLELTDLPGRSRSRPTTGG